MHAKTATNKASSNQQQPFAEVIQSSLELFLAQSWSWDQPPSFGSLVTVTDKRRTIFGLVHQIATGSIDPGRQPFAYQKSHEELQAEQPQLFEMLKTTFSCLTLGYQEKNKPTIFYLLAPQPPLIHSFVAPASPEFAQRFFSKMDYLHLLFGASAHLNNLDDLLLALLKQHHERALLNADYLDRFIETFSLLSGNDYRRLKQFLQRAEPFFKRI